MRDVLVAHDLIQSTNGKNDAGSAGRTAGIEEQQMELELESLDLASDAQTG